MLLQNGVSNEGRRVFAMVLMVPCLQKMAPDGDLDPGSTRVLDMLGGGAAGRGEENGFRSSRLFCERNTLQQMVLEIEF